ncbi:hemicentin-2 isoform X2 [Anguilla rostrata]|uniref:hemicentin-2 isoform X2 n=1 Tax=Anguilla rostrata TaxID=7938 RepID=UPI0030D31A91
MEREYLKLTVFLSALCAASGEGCSLELRPSRVVVGFGDPVSVSCVASRPVRVLGWEAAIGSAHTQSDLTVRWGVDSLRDWIEEPICYGVFFTAPRQCEEKLNLVLYNSPFFYSPDDETLEVTEGEGVPLNCSAQGNPLPAYSWSSPLNQEEKTSQTQITSTSLTPGAHSYTCTASNQLGQQSKKFTVKILSKGV